MTDTQKQQYPHIYELLRAAVTAPGDRYWVAGVIVRKPFAPVRKGTHHVT